MDDVDVGIRMLNCRTEIGEPVTLAEYKPFRT